MHEIPQIEVEMLFLTKAEGGRDRPPVFTTPTMYRPHLVVADSTDYLGVIFQAAPEFVQPQVSFTATLGLVYYPKVDYAALAPGAEFTVREGARVVARGRVTKRLYDPVA
jgi:translation elongation factor EF-Tu-like GTPase